MSSSAPDIRKATRVWVEGEWICVRLEDEFEVRFPAHRNRRLREAPQDKLANVELICDGTGIHWPDLDEDLTVAGILEGRVGT